MARNFELIWMALVNFSQMNSAEKKWVPTKAMGTSVNTFWATQIKWFLYFSLAREYLQQRRDTQIPFHIYALCAIKYENKNTKKRALVGYKGMKNAALPAHEQLFKWVRTYTPKCDFAKHFHFKKQQSPHSSIFSAFPVCINNPIIHRTDVSGTGRGEAVGLNRN